MKKPVEKGSIDLFCGINLYWDNEKEPLKVSLILVTFYYFQMIFNGINCHGQSIKMAQTVLIIFSLTLICTHSSAGGQGP